MCVSFFQFSKTCLRFSAVCLQFFKEKCQYFNNHVLDDFIPLWKTCTFLSEICRCMIIINLTSIIACWKILIQHNSQFLPPLAQYLYLWAKISNSLSRNRPLLLTTLIRNWQKNCNPCTILSCFSYTSWNAKYLQTTASCWSKKCSDSKLVQFHSF